MSGEKTRTATVTVTWVNEVMIDLPADWSDQRLVDRVLGDLDAWADGAMGCSPEIRIQEEPGRSAGQGYRADGSYGVTVTAIKPVPSTHADVDRTERIGSMYRAFRDAVQNGDDL